MHSLTDPGSELPACPAPDRLFALLLPRSLAVVLLAAALCGCQSETQFELTDESIEEMATLPGLRLSTDERLRHHYDLLQAEGTTPLQLRRDVPPEEDNVAAVFAGLFAPNFLPGKVAESHELFPRPAFEFDDVRLRKAKFFLRGLDDERAEVSRALDRPVCDFGLDPARGWYTDWSILQAVTLYIRLEAFFAAVRLDEDDLTAAGAAIARMLRMVEYLSRERDLQSRLLAADLRKESLAVLASFVAHPLVEDAHLRTFANLLQNQLARWPDEADAWHGERARALVAYEAVRRGFLFTMLTETEQRELMMSREGRRANVEARRNADADELFYLDQMRTIINRLHDVDGPNKVPVPYYRRQDVFRDFAKARQQKLDAGEYPFVAARLFLRDLQENHALVALDRARVEMWTIGLAASAGLPPPEYQTNPANGAPYQVHVESHQAIVSGANGEGDLTDENVVIVPRLNTREGRAAVRGRPR
ncbi:MAG: hypothetical protein DWQ31_13545 [Planctomycetota bacterium]|nr:MAG: hypothetical protein DWQ31_13545 [Planctomycetota bacterium]REJ90304.1 MAG: hypothetical protein DWQ35_16625 [Planctomycetota bacterium]